MRRQRYLFLCRLLAALLVLPWVVARSVSQTGSDHSADEKVRQEQWFYNGRRVVQSAAGLRRQALQKRAQRVRTANSQSLSTGTWTPLGPVPLASDASGNGTQDYGTVSGRVTAVVIDPADTKGNTVYVGGALSGIWKSTNATNADPTTVTWTPVSDDQLSLAIGAMAIQPGNSDVAKSVILAATGEGNSSGDSYFGIGILRSTNGGATWTLIPSANNGALSFEGLGGARMAFSSAAGQTGTVVSAMATSAEALINGAASTATTPGLYTSTDAGLTWSYDALSDSGTATDATSATSVVYNTGAAQFFAAVRYHGFYSSRDGLTWTRLATQPGGSVLSATACPPNSTTNNRSCPIYRGEITAVPGRNEMYAWYVSLASNGAVIDQGIWKTSNGGTSWTAISNSGITNCGDIAGCGVEAGFYNLELLAVPNGADTDLYAGAVNLYRCGIRSSNPTCSTTPFLNLTHAYGCLPIAAPAHVHPSQHALDSLIPATGTDSGNALMFFANDGGVYRALNGFGLSSGSCSSSNAFDNLNQNLGSLTQFVSLSLHPTDEDVLFGGAQGNGFPATNAATTNPSWWSVLGGSGGTSAIDPTAPANWYAANPDIPPGGLGIQLCSDSSGCNNGLFDFVASSSALAGDDAGLYVPFILDPHSNSAMLIGTCRVWRGDRSGGPFVALSPNFDTLGSGTCSGEEVNQVRSLATAGTTDQNGSSIIYATTNGLGPLTQSQGGSPGGRVWVTTDASAGMTAFSDVTASGPLGDINPNRYPISSVATDSSDATGRTAYVTVMGFTGGTGHVWKTTNAGATWTDFTGNLPDSPANAIVVYPALSQVYVATDIGVFGSAISAPSWTELGPDPAGGQSGYLPNVPVMALAIFASGGQQLLRAATYGRGVWEFPLVVTPDFQLAITNSPLTAFVGQSASLTGTITAKNGYSNSVTLSCVAGSTNPPSTCTPSPRTLTPGSKTPFTVAVGGTAGDYSFNVQAAGSDANRILHSVPVTVHLLGFGMTSPTPNSVTVGRGSSSSPVSFQVTAAGSFNQSVSVSCTTPLSGAQCTLTPSATVNPTASSPVNMTASITVPSTATAGAYTVTLQATTAGAPSPLTTTFTLNVITNPDFVMTAVGSFPEVNAGSTGTHGQVSITSQDGFSGTVALSCVIGSGTRGCSTTPSSVNAFPATATVSIDATQLAAGSYSLVLTGSSGSIVHTLTIPFKVGDYALSGPQSINVVPGAQATATLNISSSYSYTGNVTATCDVSSVSGAMCTLSPPNPIAIAADASVTLTAVISIPNDASPGSHTIMISSHDSTGTPSHSVSISVVVAQDFHVTSSTSSQTVKAGQTSGPYNLRILPVGASFDQPVTLACTAGLPAGAQCSFNPAGPITPGSSAVDVVMSISTSVSSVRSRAPVLYSSLLLWPGIIGVLVRAGRIRAGKVGARLTLGAAALLALAFLGACGGVSTGGGGSGPPPIQPITYHVTITGTAPGTPADAGQSTVVILIVD